VWGSGRSNVNTYKLRSVTHAFFSSSSYLSWFLLPLQARSYFFSIWLRGLLMLDTAVLTWNTVEASDYVMRNGGDIKQALKCFMSELEELETNRRGDEIKEQRPKTKKQLERGEEEGEEEKKTSRSRSNMGRKLKHGKHKADQMADQANGKSNEQGRWIDQAGDNIEELKDDARNKLHQGEQKVKHMKNQAADKADELKDTANSHQTSGKAEEPTDNTSTSMADAEHPAISVVFVGTLPYKAHTDAAASQSFNGEKGGKGVNEENEPEDEEDMTQRVRSENKQQDDLIFLLSSEGQGEEEEDEEEEERELGQSKERQELGRQRCSPEREKRALKEEQDEPLQSMRKEE